MQGRENVQGVQELPDSVILPFNFSPRPHTLDSSSVSPLDSPHEVPLRFPPMPGRRDTMIRSTTAIAAVLLCATPALAGFANEASYGWEDGGTILGGYNNSGMFYENSGMEAYEGTRSLFLQEAELGGTPQSFVAHVTGLTDGDTVYGSFMAWDDSIGESPSVRIWASYTSDPGDITSYAGSAGGSNTYSGGTEGQVWHMLDHEWTFDSDGGGRDGLVIQVRMYAADEGDGHYVDDLYVMTSSDTAVINFAPTPGALALLGVAGLAGRRRRA